MEKGITEWRIILSSSSESEFQFSDSKRSSIRKKSFEVKTFSRKLGDNVLECRTLITISLRNQNTNQI
jgi:hypothetical protein